MQEFRRQQEIELAKAEMERNKQSERAMDEALEHEKRVKNVEYLQFNNYMHQMRAEQKKIQMDRTDWTQAKRANDQLETDAEMERRKKRQLLNAEQRVCEIYVRNRFMQLIC